MNRQTVEMLTRVQARGISLDDALALRRISMTLQRWYELECGDGYSWIERDEDTGKPYRYVDGRYLDPKPRRYAVADREKGALKRLDKIMGRYPELSAYVQTDPRGAALFIYRKGDESGYKYGIESCYSSIGTAIYK